MKRQLAEAVLFEGLAEAAPREARLHWRLGGRHFRALGTFGPFGRPRLAGPVEMAEADGGWRPAPLAALVDALPAIPENRERLDRELRQTVALCRWNTENLPARERRALPFAALDGAMSEGHPYHPCFKARTGFSLDDHAAYGPEAARAFRLDWLALPRATVAAALPCSEETFWRGLLGAEWDRLVHRLTEAGHSPPRTPFCRSIRGRCATSRARSPCAPIWRRDGRSPSGRPVRATGRASPCARCTMPTTRARRA